VPILQIHGLEDETIKYGGGERRKDCLPSIPHWIQEWAKRDGYSAMNVSSSLFEGKAHQYAFGGGVVTHIAVEGLGHHWPSTQSGVDGNSGAAPFDATPLIMKFFADHTLEKKLKARYFGYRRVWDDEAEWDDGEDECLNEEGCADDDDDDGEEGVVVLEL
jgi:poly(3-hydroxybutyrate) depolymerase